MQTPSKPHVIPLSVYLGVGGALLVLTAVTVAVSFVNLGFFNVVIALVIATIKAALVAFFFMHLWYDSKLYFFVFATSLFFLTTLILITFFDTMRRGDIYDYRGVPIHREARIYETPSAGETDAGHEASGRK